MNCKDYKLNFEPVEDARGGFLEHEQSCDDCRVYAQEERRLTSLLSGLDKSEAPVGFGTAVRSQIDGKHSRSRLPRVAATFLLPAAALLIAAFLVWDSSLFAPPFANDSKASSVKTENQSDISEAGSGQNVGPDKVLSESSDIKTPVEEASVAENTEKGVDTRIEKSRNEIAVKEDRLTAKPVSEKPRLNSRDMGFEEPEFINPPGIDPDKVITGAPQAPEKPFSSREVLATLGIDSEWRGDKLVVVEVRDKSVGEQSGVRTGDQIRSIDGKKITKAPVSSGSAKGRVLKVVRDGKLITLNIGNTIN